MLWRICSSLTVFLIIGCSSCFNWLLHHGYLCFLCSQVHLQNLMKRRTADHPSTSVTWRMMMTMKRKKRFNQVVERKGVWLSHLSPPTSYSPFVSSCLKWLCQHLIGRITTVSSLSRGFHNMQIHMLMGAVWIPFWFDFLFCVRGWWAL